MVKKILLLVVLCFSYILHSNAQTCSLPGMTPDQAYPVCGTSVFHQSLVTNCSGPNIASTGCPQPVTSSSSFWYKFTCFQTGTLGFLLSGVSGSDDYDWAMFDVTGHNPTDVFSNSSLLVSLNIYGVSDNNAQFPDSPTGCKPGATGNKHCAGSASGNSPFNEMPTIILGHEYLLMVTNYSQSTAGYDLTFTGGSASITDPKLPHMESARSACDGTQTTIKLNKRMKCNTLTASGSEFTITPALANVISATAVNCTAGFDMDSLRLTLDAALPPGTYSINIRNGTDGNTILDNCDRAIPVNESIPVIVYQLVPTPMDSISPLGCKPDEVILVFRKNIKCSSIEADGSNFQITILAGSEPVTVTGATGICNADGLTPIIKVKLATNLSAPIRTKGTYQITLIKPIVDECGQITTSGSLIFNTKDTVNADFSYAIKYGCARDTINYFHNGKNEVNLWKWNFDRTRSSSLQNPTVLYGSFGLKKTYLIVSNGICRDTSDTVHIFLDNEVKAAFEATSVVCPNEFATFLNKSTGNIVSYNWDFANGFTDNSPSPAPQSYIAQKPDRNVFPRLIVKNNLGCFDTAVQKIIVPYSCYIAVPNAFTPNNDGLNDQLYPLNAFKARDLLFRVYNRVGQLVFETTDWTKKWDGKFKGQPADLGTYVWILIYTNMDSGKRIQQKGTTILLH